MNESVIVIVSVLVSTLITYCFVSAKEIMQSRKRIELTREMYDIVNESMDKYKEVILRLADEIDKMKEEINKEEQPMTFEEYIQWRDNSIKELSKLIGIPKIFLDKHKEEQQ